MLESWCAMNDIAKAEHFRDSLADLPDYTDRDALIDERARDLAADAFDSLSDDALEWMEQRDLIDDLLTIAYAAINPTVATREQATLAVDRMRDQFIDERMHKYVEDQ